MIERIGPWATPIGARIEVLYTARRQCLAPTRETCIEVFVSLRKRPSLGRIPGLRE